MIVAFVASVFALACSGCAFNQTGNVAAEDRGDTSRPAERGSPIAPLRDACGDGDVLARDALTRRPYLQQVTASSAMIGWVANTREPQRVIVSRPDGTRVASAPAARQHAALRDREHQQWATVTGLEPDTTYCYEILGARPLTSRTGFRTAPAGDRPVRFLAFGDSGGGGPDQLRLRSWMFDFPYDLVIHTGDIAYGEGSLAQLDENVFGVYHELLRNIPLFPAAGNHDYKTLDGAPFREVFALPGREQWYSFDWGQVHFVALDTEADYRTQAKWLEDDLAANTLPWTIVFLHRAPYSSGAHGSDKRLRKLFAPIFEKHRVQLVLAGHDHDYERTTPQNGVHYVVTGGGGRGTYDVGHSSFTAFSEEVIHFVYVEIAGDELVLHAIDATGAEFDSVAIGARS